MKKPTSQLDKTSAVTTSKIKASGEAGREKTSTVTTTKPTARATDTSPTVASSKPSSKQYTKLKSAPTEGKHTDTSTPTASEDGRSVEEIHGNEENRTQKSATGDAKKMVEEKLEPVGKETVSIVQKKKVGSIMVF